MAEMEYRVERVGDKTKILVSGEVNMKVSTKLRKALHEHLAQNPSEMVVDLAGVPFIDSSGVAILIEALRLQTKNKNVFRLENPTEQVRYTLKITQLTKVFGLKDLQEENS
jgi:anti-anti-sigma factor